MHAGAQISLYAMTDRFVSVIMDAVEVIRRHDDLQMHTDDLSTVILGEAGAVFTAIRDAFAVAAVKGPHVALNAHFSRGCPGDTYCLAGTTATTATDATTATTATTDDVPGARGAASMEPASREALYHPVAAQFALYPLGSEAYMNHIYAVIEASKQGGAYTASKNFATRLDGTVEQVFADLYQAFCAAPTNHTVLHATVSANSPSSKHQSPEADAYARSHRRNMSEAPARNSRNSGGNQ